MDEKFASGNMVAGQLQGDRIQRFKVSEICWEIWDFKFEKVKKHNRDEVGKQISFNEFC